MTLPLPLPYGLRDIKVATLSSTGVKGSLVDLPAVQTLDFSETVTSKELRGDDTTVARRTSVEGGEWSLESGGYPLEAAVVILGLTLTSSGTTPNVQKKVTRSMGDSYPDFFMEGQVLSESGGDVHKVFHRNKATKFSGTDKDQEFWITSLEGTCFPSITAAVLGKVWETVQNETVTATV